MNNNNSTQVQTLAFSGPIPHPGLLAKYEELQTGLAERIITMAEEQSKHRREMEARQLDANIKHLDNHDKSISKGQLFAFILGLITVLGGF